jgi:hypothetical protein
LRSEIHRHLVLYKDLPDSRLSLFRQIVVVEREQFELRIFESDILRLDREFTDDASGGEIHFHATLRLAVLNAESEYKQSVRKGWRAYDPAVHKQSSRGGPSTFAA